MSPNEIAASNSGDNQHWWGEYSLADGQAIGWQAGERRIALQRKTSEWKVWNVEAPYRLAAPLQRDDRLNPDSFPPQTLSRCLETQTTSQIRISPALADRPMIALPSAPLQLLAGEQTRLYVSTPLWFVVQTLPGERLILDVPIWRPSDSWFGPNTMSGEFCYAKYTDARVDLSNVEHGSHRATTPITIANKAEDTLTIERLNVPVNILRLYRDARSLLWTEGITVIREEDGSTAELVPDNQQPREAREAKLVGEPRNPIQKHDLIRTISSLFA